jgi:putative nucleotidyltransferase with HDIG domain
MSITQQSRAGQSGLPFVSSTVYVRGIILLGAGLGVVSAVALARWSIDAKWWFFLTLTVASSWATLRVPGMPISFSIADTFVFASALVFGPVAGAITAAVDGLVLSFRMASSQRTAERIAFNASAPAIAIWVAGHAYRALAGTNPQITGALSAAWLLLALMIFGILAYTLNTGIVAVAVGLERKASVFAVWRKHFSALWLNYFGGAFGAMLLTLLTHVYTLDVIILLTPLPIILYTALRHAVGRAQDQIGHLGKVNKVYVGAIEALAQAVDAKDQVTHDHVRRVQDRSLELARLLGVNDDLEMQAIKAAALLHDVGKLAIPEHILNKPGRLTPAEYDIMKRHAAIGADILSVLDFPYPVAPIVRHHHEHWDGTGYPDGIKGDAIPIGARVLSVVDCFDALTSDRPYRPRMSDADALKIITDRRGTMYDPQVVDAFFAFREVEQMTSPAAEAPAMPVIEAPQILDAGPQPDAELMAFLSLGGALSKVTRAADAVRVLHEHLQPHLPPCTMVAYGYDRGSDAIVALAETGGQSGSWAGTTIPLGERVSGWVAATHHSALNSDARLDVDDDKRAATPLRSTLAVAVTSADALYGVLSLYAPEVEAFNEKHRRLLLSAAGVLTSAPGWRAECADAAHVSLSVRHSS